MVDSTIRGFLRFHGKLFRPSAFTNEPPGLREKLPLHTPRRNNGKSLLLSQGDECVDVDNISFVLLSSGQIILRLKTCTCLIGLVLLRRKSKEKHRDSERKPRGKHESSVVFVKMNYHEKKETEDDTKGEEKQSQMHKEKSSSPNPQPRKKSKLDAGDWIGRQSSEESPSEESVSIDGKAKSSSPLESSSKHFEPTEKDVVFGKGRFIQNLAGNVRLRKLIKSHFDQYEKADCPQDKTLMAMRLVADIKESGGRFLKEDVSVPGRFIEVDSIAAREKIAATFHSHRRRSKLVNVEPTTGKSKRMAFTTSATASKPSASLMMGAKAKKDRILGAPMIHGSSIVREIGLGRRGKLCDTPPLHSTTLLQQELNQLPRRRAFELSDEMARMSRDIPSFKESLIPAYNQGEIAVYDSNAALLRENISRKQWDTMKSGSPLSPIYLESMAVAGSRSRLNLGHSAVSASSAVKNSQSLAASSHVSRIKKNTPRPSTMQRTPSNSNDQIGKSSRRFLATPAAVPTESLTASSSEDHSMDREMHHHVSQEDLQAQLYREMGLPGF